MLGLVHLPRKCLISCPNLNHKLFIGGNPPSLIAILWNIDILLHKQAKRTKHFEGECVMLSLVSDWTKYIPIQNFRFIFL